MGEGTAPTVGLMTVGCKLNQYESEGIAEAFEDAGFEVVPFTATADVYVVNTCTVTGRSDYRSRQMLRRASRLNPSAVIVATGCYAQRDPDALSSMPEVDLVVGNTAKHAISSLVAERLASRGPTARGAARSEALVPPHGDRQRQVACAVFGQAFIWGRLRLSFRHDAPCLA